MSDFQDTMLEFEVVKRIFQKMAAVIKGELDSYKVDLGRTTGVLSPKALPLSDLDAQASTSQAGFIQLATPGSAIAGQGVAADDPRVAISAVVPVTPTGTWSNDSTGRPGLRYQIDRGWVRVWGHLSNLTDSIAASTIATGLPTAEAVTFGRLWTYNSPTGAQALPIYVTTGGTLIYAGDSQSAAGVDLADDAGAPYVDLSYRVA